ncbi:hypothetical protein HBF26_17680 [Luteibacter jiangsuensis]|uniref:Integron gene cassette protein n=1 Tax=Luteibacter jiangsuensis TaxID=637577 RepID=A0ABX0QAC2_9GAMM|nr:hypothetical protein [Luteibacter jiangsuensis]NID06726.1 hypothetical protein [Luteibacter jiangsuensis]
MSLLMSLDFSLEIEEGIAIPSLFGLAESMGGQVYDRYVWFERSELNLFIGDNYGDPDVGAEDPALTWQVGARCIAVMRPRSYDACWYELERFIRALAEHFSQRFVLSFGYDSIYAVRDANGLRFLKSGVAT